MRVGGHRSVETPHGILQHPGRCPFGFTQVQKQSDITKTITRSITMPILKPVDRLVG